MTIDLSLMNPTSYDRKSNIAKIEPGGRWKNLFADLDRDRVTVASGRDSGVGRTNADSWRALKGGSNNFGIVTRFDLEAIPARDLYYDLRLLDSAYSDSVVDAVVGQLRDTRVYNPRQHDGQQDSATALQRIEDLPIIANITIFQGMAEAAADSQIAPGSGPRNAGSTLSAYNDPQIVRRFIELHMQLVETLKGFINPDRFRTLSLFQSIPSYMGQSTKCDRCSPCASCVTLNVACRTTRRAPEKRQRVLLPSKYEDAVQEIGHHLADAKGMLHTLISSRGVGSCPPSSTGGSSEYAHRTQSPMIDEQVPSLSRVHEGSNGDPSFQSHAHRVESALGRTLPASELIDVEVPMTLPPDEAKEPLHSAGTTNSTTSDRAGPGNLPPPHNLELRGMPLPPIDVILKLLRLAKADKQRFFVDVPLFQEVEFADMCRGVYFATEPISIRTWICVNVSLYFLLLGVSEVNCRCMGTSVEAIRSHSRVLMANAETALQSLRLCSEPSAEPCRALALLGDSTVAWRLVSWAARASLDLGLHRLANRVDG
ncbi:hypothetical protein DL767_004514 [Monosporascus sp. MG133]|nr:hypothetical protein DL767_004514 [Monosporascus sp. MG133]